MDYTGSQHPGQIGKYWLSQRPNSPAWCRTWFCNNTRQTRRASLGTTDFQEAQQRLAEWITKHQTLRHQLPEDMPLETVLVRYFENHAQKIQSCEQEAIALRKWSDFFAGNLVSELTPDRLDDFIQSMKDAGLSNGYINRTLSPGRAALNRAVKRQELVRAPYIPQLPAGEPRERVLSIQEAAALFDACSSDHLFVYLMLAFGTLARPTAILELKSEQLDFGNRLIHLNPKGRRQNKKHRPTVPMCDTLVPILSNLENEHVVSYFGKPVKSIKTAFRAARKKAGLSDDVIPYTIRHTMGTELRKREVSQWELAGIMGHRGGGFRTTEIYAKYDPKHMGEAIQAINTYFTELDALTSRSLLTI